MFMSVLADCTCSVWPQGVKDAQERAAREDRLLRQYEVQEAERIAAAAADKRLKKARMQADIEQVSMVVQTTDIDICRIALQDAP